MSRRRVDGDDLDDEAGLVTFGGERFSGIAVDRFPDGRLHGETEYRDGIQDGLSRTYWPGGGLRVERWYDYGVRLRDRSWYEDGSPREDVVLDQRGVKHHYEWSPDGTVTRSHYRGRD